MKKRKKPIFLVSALVLLAAVVLAMNSSVLGASTRPDDDQPSNDSSKAASSATASTAPAPQAALVSPDATQPPDVDPAMNIKARDYIAPDKPKISVSYSPPPKQKDPEHATALANSGWYMNVKKSSGK